MSKSLINCLLVVCISLILLLTGCFNQKKPVEEMYEVLERVVTAEQVFDEQQDPLVALEKRETEIYDKIISLGMKEFEEISKLSDEASQIVDERKEHMLKEEESIKASEKEFKNLTPLIEQIDEPSLKEKSQKLFDIMIERYNIYYALYEQYSKALELDKQLYAMFKRKDLDLMELEEQITEINKVYEGIIAENVKFNEKTKQYNEMKLSFYKESGLDVNMNE